ncbi:MAG: 2-C-methyl-D-erythritol 2,4-cyclodiphosphate synthase [Kiritimatiellae bacterium]|nr:2-C-methyl-D-erythritol 2,4-cyclodiphosphate synthase [Kiritimatiellia bacterium]
MRTGIGFDAHRLVPGYSLVLGGVNVDAEYGLDGHSDADVLCHALIDAILGAAADGDIGTHFPDNDQKWKNARSLDLLKMTVDRLAGTGISILNVDSTIIAEAPRLSPYIQDMRENIAGALGVDPCAVSVKATTVEKLGALGRKEGIAAMAVATIES